jgi:hypothetical protein
MELLPLILTWDTASGAPLATVTCNPGTLPCNNWSGVVEGNLLKFLDVTVE